MKDSNDSIRQENKKALPKFILLSAAGLFTGLILGLALVWLGFENLGTALDAAGLFLTVSASPWLLAALPVAELAVCLPIYFKAKQRLAGWDGEDEGVSSGIEVRLSVCLWLTSMATILDFLLAAVLFSGLVETAGNPIKLTPVKFFGGSGAFLVTLYLSAVLQQKAVDAAKRLNPEKRGSVYDTRFHKKWLESCDEAERAVIGQCAFKAYMAMTRTCLILWAVLALGGMLFSWGFLPAMTVCVVWGVGQTVYSYWCLKLGTPGGAGSPM